MAKKTDIINNVIQIIAEDGIQNLSIRNIAQRVGITESTIYSHFRNKDEIITYLLELYIQDIKGLWSELLTQNQSSLKVLELFFKQICLGYRLSPEYTKAFWFGTHQFKGVHFDNVRVAFDIHRQNLIDIIEKGQLSGELMNNHKKEYLSSLVSGQIYIFLFRSLCLLNYNDQTINELWAMLESILTKSKT